MISLNINKKKIIHKFLCILSATIVVYNIFYVVKPPDVITYFNLLESFRLNTNSIFILTLSSFDLGYIFLISFNFFGETVFFLFYSYIIFYILYSLNNLLTNNLLIIILSLLIFIMPGYLPAKFLVSTFRQTFSLFFFFVALNSSSKTKRNLFFILSILGHFTGILNFVILFISKIYNDNIKIKKSYLILFCLSSFFLFWNADLLVYFFNKLDHYSENNDTTLGFFKTVIILFIILFGLMNVFKFKKFKEISLFMIIYLMIILFSQTISHSISNRLFNSIYFMFPIYSLCFLNYNFKIR